LLPSGEDRAAAAAPPELIPPTTPPDKSITRGFALTTAVIGLEAVEELVDMVESDDIAKNVQLQ
jgi:hypothetical protein